MRKINKARFEALSYARIPLVKTVSDEIEWYASPKSTVLGVILRDKADGDFVSIVLGRDEVGVFRWIDGQVSIGTIDLARAALEEKMNLAIASGAEEFPQGVTNRDKNLIFEPLVSESAMPEDYKTLVKSELFSPAREIIQEIAYSFEDPDGNYIQQFQSTGFNPRMWELYLYALFHELDFVINRDFNAPDYVIEKSGKRICVEAVTVNPSQIEFDEEEPKTSQELERLLSDYIPIKYGSPLFTKLRKEYWKKEHVAGHPIAIAVHDFHKKDSMMWTRPGLQTYLYGAKVVQKEDGTTSIVELIDEHKWKEKVIPSGFFSLPEADNISAVIHSDQATIGKFLRMGHLAEFGKRDMDIRLIGHAIVGKKGPPVEYDIDINASSHKEFWRNSVTIYHNPNAKHPLDYRLFEGVAHVFFKNGQFVHYIPEFYPLYGRTVYRAKEKS